MTNRSASAFPTTVLLPGLNYAQIFFPRNAYIAAFLWCIKSKVIRCKTGICQKDCLQLQQLTRSQYKGYLKALQTCVTGLEFSYNASGSNGLASLFHVLEIAHTHYWSKEIEAPTPTSASGGLVKLSYVFATILCSVSLPFENSVLRSLCMP